MRFIQSGISFKEADQRIRDQVHFTDTRKMDLLEHLSAEGIRQVLILSTCNRSEIFYFIDSDEQEAKAEACIAECFGEEPYRHCSHRSGHAAIRYLFDVTCGMESQVIGEDQILGQVKEAEEFCRTMGTCGKELSHLVQNAMACSKHLKTTLKVSEIPLSVAYIAIRQLQQCCEIDGKRVFIIGSGKTAVLAMQYVKEHHPLKITVCNRTLEHAQELQKTWPDIEIVPFNDRYEISEQSDIVISATNSPHLVIRKEEIQIQHPTVFLDLASPRDIDPSLDDNGYVTRIDLDSLQTISSQNEEKRRELLETKGREVICAAVEDNEHWLSTIRLDPTIQSLQEKVAGITEDTYAYLNRKMNLNEHEKIVLKKTLEASFARILREPIAQLRSLDDEQMQKEYQLVVEDLFKLKGN